MLLDLSLVTTAHLLVVVVVFVVVAAALAYTAKHRRHNVGFWLALAVTLAAWFALPPGSERWGLVVAAVILTVVGLRDEIKPLSARWQLMWQLIIAVILVLSAWTIPYVSNPWGVGVIQLEWSYVLGIAIPGGILAIAWIVLMMNAVNWLDGSDGLAGSVTLIGFLALAAVATLPSLYDAVGLQLALIGVAGLLAFCIWNFPPAKVYLGTIGSWFVGMYIALVAMRGGGKIATALLILALPLLDMVIVIVRRWLSGQPIWQGDVVHHLHHRLRLSGVPAGQVVLLASAVTLVLAVMSIVLPTSAKLIALVVVAAGVGVSILRLVWGRRTIKRSYEEVISHR